MAIPGLAIFCSRTVLSERDGIVSVYLSPEGRPLDIPSLSTSPDTQRGASNDALLAGLLAGLALLLLIALDLLSLSLAGWPGPLWRAMAFAGLLAAPLAFFATLLSHLTGAALGAPAERSSRLTVTGLSLLAALSFAPTAKVLVKGRVAPSFIALGGGLCVAILLWRSIGARLHRGSDRAQRGSLVSRALILTLGKSPWAGAWHDVPADDVLGAHVDEDGELACLRARR